MGIPSVVEQKLNEELWKRGGDTNVDAALTSLGIGLTSEFAEFYRRYWGPFHGSKVGHELLDIVRAIALMTLLHINIAQISMATDTL